MYPQSGKLADQLLYTRHLCNDVADGLVPADDLSGECVATLCGSTHPVAASLVPSPCSFPDRGRAIALAVAATLVQALGALAAWRAGGAFCPLSARGPSTPRRVTPSARRALHARWPPLPHATLRCTPLTHTAKPQPKTRRGCVRVPVHVPVGFQHYAPPPCCRSAARSTGRRNSWPHSRGWCWGRLRSLRSPAP